ncbi:Hcp family type VI secretion system effector [Rhodocyclus tenuis]|uniref:Hcp family type VI secretion system effector n=1 Tax=Rhodocyclus tenuis TaxID=1066 RepID=UPI001908BDE3|nr:type VI secretion system tube protein Hcp [Rhodocyclus tenuis]
MLTQIVTRSKAALVVGTFAVAAYATPAAASTSYLLSFDGIAGSSTSEQFKGAIDIDSFNWGVSGTAGGKPVYSDFAWEQIFDSSSPVLIGSVGKTIKSATLTAIRDGERPTRYFDVVFSDVVLHQYWVSGTPAGLNVSGAFGYNKFVASYWPQNSDGSLGTPIVQSYEVAAAVPEAESYAMLLAGLGVLGFVARRRKQQASVA